MAIYIIFAIDPVDIEGPIDPIDPIAAIGRVMPGAAVHFWWPLLAGAKLRAKGCEVGSTGTVTGTVISHTRPGKRANITMENHHAING